MNLTNVRLAARFLAFLFLANVLGGCAIKNLPLPTARQVTSVVDFLFPNYNNDTEISSGTPVFNLPLNVGIAFVPSIKDELYPTENKKWALMQKVADHFKQHSFIDKVQLIPTYDLSLGGSFSNLDKLHDTYGVDVIALVSYDQTQFNDNGMGSVTSIILIGDYVVKSKNNDTYTLLDVVVYDIKSRKMLFRAPGTNREKGSSTLAALSENLRADSNTGFEKAAQNMISNLDEKLTLFREELKSSPDKFKVVE